MFGYVKPLKDELKIYEYGVFKSYYCGLCFHLKKAFGNLPRMALNYDMTFLAILLDSLEPIPVKPVMKRCMTSPFKKKPVIMDNEALLYAAHMTTSLMYYKLQDDVLDDKNLKSSLLAFALAPYKQKFSEDVIEINQMIQENLTQLYHLEQTQNFSSLDEICDPFSLIVASLFKMYPHSFSKEDPAFRENLFHFGYALGKWIYMIDALDDLQKDMEKQKFNPLNFLYNKESLTYPELLEQIKDRVSFTILNCGYNCKYYLELLPIYKNKNLLDNIITLGMMDQYNKVIQTCPCKEKNHQKSS